MLFLLFIGITQITVVLGDSVAPITLVQSEIGSILTDSHGKTLYVFANDIPGSNTSACSGSGCTGVWPPYFADLSGISRLSDPLHSEDFSTFVRTDGKNQTTFHGWPLYSYSGDINPGDVTGQAYNNSWYVMGVSGMISTVPPVVTVPPTPIPPPTTVQTSVSTPVPTKPPGSEWYTLTFQNGGMSLQAESPGYSIIDGNQSVMDEKNNMSIHGKNAGIFLAGFGMVIIQNITFQTAGRSEVRIDPGSGYTITITNKSPYVVPTSKDGPVHGDPISIMIPSTGMRDDDGLNTRIHVNKGGMYAVNLSFQPRGPGGYHLNLTDANGSVLYDISDWETLPEGVRFDNESQTLFFKDGVLPNVSVTYSLNSILTISGISPSSAMNTNDLRFDLEGSRFQTGTRVYLIKDGEYTQSARDISVISPQTIQCTLPINKLSPGVWQVMVRNPDGSTAVLPGGLAITSPVSLPFFPDISISFPHASSMSLFDQIGHYLHNQTDFIVNATSKADFGITHITDFSSITFHYNPASTDTPPLSGWKFRSDLQGTGVYDDGGNRPGKDRVWMFKTGGEVVSSPVIVQNVVYIGSTDSFLYALDASDGHEFWKFQTDGAVYSSPAVVNNCIFFGSADNRLYCLDATNGKEKWRVQTGGIVSSSPTVIDNVVYVGSEDNNLYAFDALDGQEIWRHEIQGPTSPVIAHNMIYIGSIDGRIYALNATDGEEIWHMQTGDLIRSSPAIGYGLVYIGSFDNKVHAIDAITGIERWTFHTGNNIWSSPAVANGLVYIGSDDTWIYAIDAISGTRKWMFETGKEVRSSPVVAQGIVYVGGYDSYIYAINALTGGREKWMSPTGGSMRSSPAVVNGMLYVGNNDSNVYAFGNSRTLRVQIPKSR
ncbi:outer membrane protein assembly factor BamB family protein [Methanospirillum lacunae]|nr:PQQ-binding-like beta-propeller repeat protein [Methanospirillum lacunae]